MSDEAEKKTGRKIIQKKIKKRERYARMARLRYRKEKNVPTAHYSFLKRSSRYSNPHSIKLLPLGLFYSQTVQNPSSDISLLNEFKISPSTEISQNEPDVLKVNMHTDFAQSGLLIEEKDSQPNILGHEGSEFCSFQLQNFNRGYMKFKADILNYDERDKKQELIEKERFNNYTELRSNLFSNNPCIEFRSKSIYEDFHISEIYFNNSFIYELGHSQETFNNIILKEGFPEITTPGPNSLIQSIKKCIEGFDFTMDAPKRIKNLKTTLILRSLLMKDAYYDLFITAYHRKKVPEVSFILVFNDFKLTLNKYTPQQFSPDFIKSIENLYSTKSDFLKRFYPDESKAFFKPEPKVCLIRDLLNPESDLNIEPAKDIKLTKPPIASLVSTQSENTKSESPKSFSPVIVQSQKTATLKGLSGFEDEEKHVGLNKIPQEDSIFKSEKIGESRDYTNRFSKQGFRKVKEQFAFKRQFETEEDKHLAELDDEVLKEFEENRRGNMLACGSKKSPESQTAVESRNRVDSADEDLDNPDRLNNREFAHEELISSKPKDVKSRESQWTKTEKPVFGQAAQVQN